MHQILQSAGVAIRYTDEGESDPVLLIHGYTGAAGMWEETGTTARSGGITFLPRGEG